MYNSILQNKGPTLNSLKGSYPYKHNKALKINKEVFKNKYFNFEEQTNYFENVCAHIFCFYNRFFIISIAVIVCMQKRNIFEKDQ